MADDPDASDDVGWWDCSLCTYKNSADKFKCEICDLRRGTSTRKPRCNADTIVAQVVKQQEQIRQQTQSKPATPKSGHTSKSAGSSSSSTTVNTTANSTSNGTNNSNMSHNTNNNNTSSSNNNSSINNSNNDDDDDYYDEEEYLSSPEPTTSSPHSQNNQLKPEPEQPIEIKGNLIKYAPPKSTGRSGLIINRRRYTQHSVTVNDVTITFTEYPTRQNNYVRKKKKRREH